MVLQLDLSASHENPILYIKKNQVGSFSFQVNVDIKVVLLSQLKLREIKSTLYSIVGYNISKL
jgi:hypothetical protein